MVSYIHYMSIYVYVYVYVYTNMYKCLHLDVAVSTIGGPFFLVMRSLLEAHIRAHDFGNSHMYVCICVCIYIYKHLHMG